MDRVLGRGAQQVMQSATAEQWQLGDSICRFIRARVASDASLASAVRSYVRTCHEHFKLQATLVRTGRYHISEINGVHASLYAEPGAMVSYLDGLLLTQVWWANHFSLVSMFRRFLDSVPPKVRYLEIGVGHGLYFTEVSARRSDIQATGLDISATALAYTQALWRFRLGERPLAAMVHADVRRMTLQEIGRFDAISVAEVIEHVPDPETVLAKVEELLAPDGVVYLTTAINAAAIDHVYLFEDVDEARALLTRCGFRITDELVLPTTALPEAELRARRVPINYGCALRRANAVKPPSQQMGLPT